MARSIITHVELDRILDRLAADVASFDRELAALAADLDTRRVDLDITDPATWHPGKVSVPEAGRTSIENQLRAEIDQITHMDRAEEARLARRIELARLRLKLALIDAGLSEADVQPGAAGAPTAYVGHRPLSCSLPPRVCRRWAELHALRSEMVERNLYLVLINVERYAHTSAGRLDLIQEGSAALFRAVDGFDWKRGLLFRTYAVHWLNQAFRSYLYNFGSTVRVPVYLQKALKHVHTAQERLHDRNASVESLASEAGLGENLVESALFADRSTQSLDAPLGDPESAGTLRDTLSSGDQDPYRPEIEDSSLEQGVGEALDRLSERERLVVCLRFGLRGEREHTLAEVAARMGVSLERVRQIQVRAIGKLRTRELRRAVDPFLN
jgi:RNA polymerase sigma factor (sigma-70 family)